jgi:hypothetical protein
MTSLIGFIFTPFFNTETEGFQHCVGAVDIHGMLGKMTLTSHKINPPLVNWW